MRSHNFIMCGIQFVIYIAYAYIEFHFNVALWQRPHSFQFHLLFLENLVHCSLMQKQYNIEISCSHALVGNKMSCKCHILSCSMYFHNFVKSSNGPGPSWNLQHFLLNFWKSSMGILLSHKRQIMAGKGMDNWMHMVRKSLLFH